METRVRISAAMLAAMMPRTCLCDCHDDTNVEQRPQDQHCDDCAQ
jgi:hypothetical protein